MTTGACLSCNGGNILSGSTCVESTKAVPNPFCRVYSGVICTFCQIRYYLGPDGICIAVDLACNDYNMKTGDCFSCYHNKIPFRKTCI
jgi:hypothetical protein